MARSVFRVHREHPDFFMSNVSFSPDGNYLAAASDDDTAKVWAFPTGVEVAQAHHDRKVVSVAFSPEDGKYLATAPTDNTARVWKVASGEEVVRVRYDGRVVSVAFSPNGKYLAIAPRDGIHGESVTARPVYYWRPEDLIKEACKCLARNQTQKEWRTYLERISKLNAAPAMVYWQSLQVP